jgi:hypothetical protein
MPTAATVDGRDPRSTRGRARGGGPSTVADWARQRESAQVPPDCRSVSSTWGSGANRPSGGQTRSPWGGTRNAGEEETRRTGNPYPVNVCNARARQEPWETPKGRRNGGAPRARGLSAWGGAVSRLRRRGAPSVSGPRSSPSGEESPGPRTQRKSRPTVATARDPREARAAARRERSTGGIPRSPQIQEARTVPAERARGLSALGAGESPRPGNGGAGVGWAWWTRRRRARRPLPCSRVT